MFSAFLLSTKRLRERERERERESERERERERRYPGVAKRRETTRPDLALGLCQEPIGTRARDKLDSAWRRRLPPSLHAPSQGCCWPIDLLQTGRRHLCCRHSVNTQTPKSVHLCRLSGQPFLQPARSSQCCPASSVVSPWLAQLFTPPGIT